MFCSISFQCTNIFKKVYMKKIVYQLSKILLVIVVMTNIGKQIS